MFDIGFSELLLVFVIGLVVLGPQRLPVAVKTVLGWVRALRSLATTVQNELAQELKLQELQDSLKKVERASLENLTPELKASMDELRQAAESMRRSYNLPDVEKASDAVNRILAVEPQAAAEKGDGEKVATENAPAENTGNTGKTDTGKTDTGKTDTGKADEEKPDTRKANTIAALPDNAPAITPSPDVAPDAPDIAPADHPSISGKP